MDFEKIRELAKFADNLNFTETAREMHVSQSSLSRHIHDMERELGVTLVNRSATGENTLTAAGRTYLESAVPLVQSHDRLVSKCREMQSVLPPARIHQDVRYVTNVAFQVRELLESQGLPSGNISYVSTQVAAMKALDQDILDFAFYASPASDILPSLEAGYGFIALRPETLCVLVNAANPLAQGESINLQEIEQSTIITIESSRDTNWVGASTELFAAQNCKLTFKYVPDNPFRGGAFPIGMSDIVLCTKYYARYYENLEVEDVKALRIEKAAPVLYPYLIYRHDMSSVVGNQIVQAAMRASKRNRHSSQAMQNLH